MTAAAARLSAVPLHRRVTSTLFAAAALAFFLPFGTVSCGEEEVTVTGVDLVTFTVEGAEKPGSLAAEVETHGFTALLALAFCVVGIAVAAVRDRGGGWAVAGLCALFLLAFNDDTILGADVEFEAGYILAVLGLVGAGLARFGIRVAARSNAGERVWTWVVALGLGTPVTAVALVWFGAGLA